MNGSEKRVPVAFVCLGNGTVYAATRPARERTRVRGSGVEARAEVAPFVPHDEHYEKASDDYMAYLRHLGHEDA